MNEQQEYAEKILQSKEFSLSQENYPCFVLEGLCYYLGMDDRLHKEAFPEHERRFMFDQYLSPKELEQLPEEILKKYRELMEMKMNMQTVKNFADFVYWRDDLDEKIRRLSTKDPTLLKIINIIKKSNILNDILIPPLDMKEVYETFQNGLKSYYVFAYIMDFKDYKVYIDNMQAYGFNIENLIDKQTKINLLLNDLYLLGKYIRIYIDFDYKQTKDHVTEAKEIILNVNNEIVKKRIEEISEFLSNNSQNVPSGISERYNELKTFKGKEFALFVKLLITKIGYIHNPNSKVLKIKEELEKIQL